MYKNRKWVVLLSVFIVIFFDYFNISQISFIASIVSFTAFYFIVYEIILQIIKYLYPETYNYLFKFINGNLKLNTKWHNNDPLTLWQKSKISLFMLFIHITTLLFVYYINFMYYYG
jgi:hypothetical protein